jgi:hypothetical protein
LEAIRYLWKGTRWRTGQQRFVAARVGGYVLDGDEPRAFGAIVDDVRVLVAAASLDPIRHLCLAEFYGLEGYPSDLIGGLDPLVGRVPNPTRAGLAGRTTVTRLREEAVASVADGLAPRPCGGDVPVSLLASAIEKPGWLSATGHEDTDLLEAVFHRALDLIDRSPSAPQVRMALWHWADRFLRQLAPPAGTALRLMPEHRRMAHAALDVAAAQVRDTGTGRSRRVPTNPSTIPVASPARVLDSRHGLVVQDDLSADELVLLVGDVFEGDDADGTIADFVIPVLVGDLPAGVDRATQRLLTWIIVRHLASRSDWRAVELASVAANVEPDDGDAAALLVYAAHVASLHRHHALARRLLGAGERLVAGRPADQVTAVLLQARQVASGIAVRTADALLGNGRVEPARQELERARRLHEHWRQLRPEAPSPIMAITDRLRAAEILFVAERLRRAGRPLLSLPSDPLTPARRFLDQASRDLAGVDPSDDDATVLEGRVTLLDAALTALQVDDSPPGTYLPRPGGATVAP